MTRAEELDVIREHAARGLADKEARDVQRKLAELRQRRDALLSGRETVINANYCCCQTCVQKILQGDPRPVTEHGLRNWWMNENSNG